MFANGRVAVREDWWNATDPTSGYVPPTSGATSTSIPAFFSQDPSAWASLTPAQQAAVNASQGWTQQAAQPATAAPTTDPTSGYVPPTSGATSTSIPAFFSQDPSAWASLTPAQQAAVNASQGWTQQAAQPATAAPTTGTVTAPAQTAAPATPATPTANPLQPTYLPNPPPAQATTYTNTYDPSTATNELNQAASVQDIQQNQNLMSMLAAQGISPGSSAAQAAAQNLANTQTAALAPSLVSAQEYGAGLNTQAGLANAGASNQMTLQNLQDLLQTQQFNASAANTAGTNLASMQNQDWLAQLEAQLGLQQTGLSTSGSLAGQQANQTVPMNPSLFSQIMAPVQAGAGDFATVASG